jgi:cysteine-rich CPXCG protein
LTDAEVDELYGLDPVIGDATSVDSAVASGFVPVACPYCGEEFETSVDASAGLCSYVEDCQVCCQPIEMELRVDENGNFSELLLRRGDA